MLQILLDQLLAVRGSYTIYVTKQTEIRERSMTELVMHRSGRRRFDLDLDLRLRQQRIVNQAVMH
jgi:hypothetical protein